MESGETAWRVWSNQREEDKKVCLFEQDCILFTWGTETLMEFQIKKIEMEQDQRLKFMKFLFPLLTEASETSHFPLKHTQSERTGDLNRMIPLDLHRSNIALISRHKSCNYIVKLIFEKSFKPHQEKYIKTNSVIDFCSWVKGHL